MPQISREIGAVIMASGLSERYGRNKLLEKLDGREIVLRAVDCLAAAGLSPLAVTRSAEVKALLDREGFRCVLHDGLKKSDTIHAGLRHLDSDAAGYLFQPGDQPLVRPESVRKMAEAFLKNPLCAVRLGFGDTAGSPVLFPASCRQKLLAYTGDRGGLEVLKNEHLPCAIVQADYAWELWDADTPEKMEEIRQAYFRFTGRPPVSS